MRLPAWLLTAVVVVVFGVRAQAAPLALGDVRGEVDVLDEAGAISLLVRSALSDIRPLVTPPQGVTLASAAEVIGKLGATHLVLLEVVREGTGLRVTLAIVAADGTRDISYVRAGDGDVSALAKAIADKVTASLATTGARVAETPLGALRPYVRAIRLVDKPDEAVDELHEAVPTVALAVPSTRVALAGVPAGVTVPGNAVIAARALRDIKKLELIAGSSDPAATAARAFAALVTSDARSAEAAIGAKPARDGLIALANVVIAEVRGDNKALADRLTSGLASDRARAVLAVAASLEHARLAPATHRMLVGMAVKLKASPGVASRIGLNAALAGIDLVKALALVDARELDAYDLTRLGELVAKGTDATSLRLRAEIAMRRGDGTEAVAIQQLVDIAPNDRRTRRYQGWLLAGQGKHAEAAAAFAAADWRAEHVRALAAAGQLEAAIHAMGGPPTSPEELAIAARAAIALKQTEVAVTKIALAEGAAPISPLIHQAIIELDALKPQQPRLMLAQEVVTKASASGISLASTSPVSPAIQTAGNGSASVASKLSVGVDRGQHAYLLEPMLAQLPGLTRLRSRKLVLAEVGWDQPITTLKVTNTQLLRDALGKLLAAPPFKLTITDSFEHLPDAPVQPSTLAKLATDADGVLLFRVEPRGDAAHVTLMLYHKAQAETLSTASVIDLPGLVGRDTDKVYVLGAIGSALVLSFLVWLLRARGKVRLDIKRAPDIDEEVLCVVVTKSPRRPLVEDPMAFHTETRKAGAITKARSATLIAGGTTLKIPTGKWHVHLYGAYKRAGGFRAVPSGCSQEVEVKRGGLHVLSFDLGSKLAEVIVEVVAKQKRGIAVWTNDANQEKTFTDSTGVAVLQLPPGTHTIYIEVDGQRFEQQEQITAAKLHRISFNVERERRLADGIAIDLGISDTPALEKSPEPSVKFGTPKAAPIGSARTVAATEPLPPGISMPDGLDAVSAPRVATRPVVSRASSPAVGATQAGGADLAVGGSRFARPATPLPGEKLLDRYRVVSELGRGAMGIVHRAWDEKLEREVAIKEMASELRTHPQALQLFTQEAKALAQLNHSNIVAMYDQITDDNGVYMVMEFVDGRPLEKLVEERGALPWREAVGLIDQVCAGLAYAHARKVIHRDIKPANIFVGNDRTVKIGDFGLARVMREVTIRRTEIRGTPLYMAPEQITGTNVDHRSDLYAMGCTLFELVCGRPPFIDGDILYAQMHAPPPPASLIVADIPEALEVLLASLLAKQADDRPGSANEVRTALRQLFAP